MKLASRLALALAATAAFPFGAIAADYDPPMVIEQPAEEYVPVEVGSGWYLRGDIGYAASSNLDGVDYRTFDGFTYGSASFATAGIEKSPTLGVGVGYRFTDWVRAEAMVDGFRTDFSGTTTSTFPCSTDPAFAGTGCRSQDASEFSAISVMANGYVDLGTISGFTPYVGGGLGYTYLSWDGLNSASYCTAGVAFCPTPGAIATTSNPGVDGWRFTYALMAGVAYDIDKNLKLDLGYKYRHIDGGDMFGWDSFSSGIGASGVQGSHGDIEQHEIKIGLRYEMW